MVRAVCRLLSEEAGLDYQDLLQRIQFVEDRPGHDRRYAMNSRRIREALGWAPVVRFGDGLRRTVRWYLDHQTLVDRITSGEYQKYYDAVYVQGWRQKP